jgi:hypothetical protein
VADDDFWGWRLALTITCGNCDRLYGRTRPRCPWCGHSGPRGGLVYTVNGADVSRCDDRTCGALDCELCRGAAARDHAWREAGGGDL